MALRRFLAGMVLVGGAIGVAAPAFAETLVFVDTTANGYNGNNGGEFAVQSFTGYFLPPPTTVSVAGEFRTFCLEKNESLNFGVTYDYTIGNSANLGGNFGGPNDPISEATAKLFYTFWTTQWAAADASDLLNTSNAISYDYSGSDRAKHAADLQDAIWFLENEFGTDNTTGTGTGWSSLSDNAKNMVRYARDGDLSWADLGRSSWADGTIGGVAVINPTYGVNQEKKQSQLIVVPLPAGAMMGFALLGVLGLASRVKARRKHSFV